MNKRLFWTTATLLSVALGTPLASHAQPIKPVNPPRVNRQATSPQTAPPDEHIDVIRVGEYQSEAGTKANDIIAKIQPYEEAGRQVATLYVYDIPVLTFLGSTPVATSGTTGVIGDGDDENLQATTPVWRATVVAAKLNQLSQDKVDASKITVNWQARDKTQAQKPGERYLIKVNGEKLVEINSETRLAATTNDLAQDALQATNRLRRLLGNAPPLRQIAGRPMSPKLPKEISLGPVRISLSGLASWYGPEFDGNESASGETFNQNELTAANRSLPFGTKVRVTDLQNGRSVVVRINDRGPYAKGRIIDLSTAAARILGLIQTGVAPVRIDVLSD
jgi:rare lipoprotein A